MAIWFMDGFDHYTDDTYGAGGVGAENTSLDVQKKWSGFSGTWANILISPFYARQRPGQGIFLPGTGGILYRNRAASQATLFGGSAVFVTTFGTYAAVLSFVDLATEQCSVRLDAVGHVTFTRNGTVLATSTNTLTVNTWYYVEAKATINNTTGQFEVRVNGTSTGWIPQSTADQNTRTTSNNYATGMGIMGYGIMRQDDVYFGDTTGTNTDFLGPCSVITLRPTGPGNYTQWTPNYGNNFANVNEIYPDYDITFNQSSTVDQIDSFTFPKIPFASGSVFAIQHVLYARQDAGAARSIAAFERSGGADYPGTTQNLTSTYLTYIDPKDVDPVDDNPWTISKVNACEFGYKLIS